MSLFTFFGINCVTLKGNNVEETISVDFRKILCKFFLVKQNFFRSSYVSINVFLGCIYNAKLQYLIFSYMKLKMSTELPNYLFYYLLPIISSAILILFFVFAGR